MARRRLVKQLLRTSFPDHRLKVVKSTADERAAERRFRRLRSIESQLSFRVAKELALYLADAECEEAVIPKTRDSVVGKSTDLLVVGCESFLVEKHF
jgi:hypothetical protein